MKRSTMVRWGIAAAALMVVAVGCDTLTYEKFNTISNGDTKEGVEATIGAPNDKVADYWRWYRRDRQLEVFVHFDNGGRVASKSWIGEGKTHVEDLPGSESEGEPGMKSTRIQSINKP